MLKASSSDTVHVSDRQIKSHNISVESHVMSWKCLLRDRVFKAAILKQFVLFDCHKVSVLLIARSASFVTCSNALGQILSFLHCSLTSAAVIMIELDLKVHKLGLCQILIPYDLQSRQEV